MNINAPIFLTRAALARQLNVAPATLASRISTGDLAADAQVIAGEKQPLLLFAVNRLSAIREIVNNPIHKARS